jgi:hypothetical protein
MMNEKKIHMPGRLSLIHHCAIPHSSFLIKFVEHLARGDVARVDSKRTL